MKTNVKLVFLIISSPSDVQNPYDEFKRRAQTYLQPFSQANLIEFLFIELNTELSCTFYDEKTHTLSFPGNESTIPGIYDKTLRAIQYVQENYTYEYLIRTNLSAVWNIPNTLSYFQEKPTTNFAGGFVGTCSGTQFLEGIAICISPDVASYLVDMDEFKYLYSKLHDDVLIGKRLLQQYSFFKIQPSLRMDLISNRFIPFQPRDNILLYRIKNKDRNIDLLYMDKLHI